MDDYTEIEIPPGALAEVVTYLEMRTPPASRPPRDDAPWRLEHRPNPDVDWYLRLYRQIGARWLWYSRLAMPREKVAAILADPAVAVHVLRRDDRDVGIVEFDLSDPAAVEICFFGVADSEIGRGAGAWLMARALEIAWASGPDRVWLHTCTLDHPNALPFYLKQGFRAYKRTLAYNTDPRHSGVLPIDAAPHIPVIPVDSRLE